MAEFHGNTLPEYKAEDSSEKKDKKKKGSKKESPFRLPPFAKVEQDGIAESTEEVSAMDKLLADLAIKRDKERAKEKPAEKAEETGAEKPEEAPEKPVGEATTIDEAAEKPAETAEDTSAEKEETDEESPIHAEELPPSRISLGEGILDLGHDDEAVIELRRTRPAEERAETDDSAEPEAEPAAAGPDPEVAPALPAAEAPQEGEPAEPENNPAPRQAPQAVVPPGNTVPPAPNVAPNAVPHSPNLPPQNPNLPPSPPPSNPNLPPPGPQPQPNPNNAPNTLLAQPILNPNLPPQNPNTAPGPNQHITRQQLEDEVYYARKRGLQNGVVTGLFAAGLYEHFKHRRREKKTEKRFKQQGRQLEQARQDLTFTSQEMERRQAEQARQKAETDARLAAAERQRVEAAAVQSRAETLRPQPEKPRRSFEYGAAAPAMRPEHIEAPIRSAETDKKPEKLVVPVPERVAPERVAAEGAEQLTVAAGHRLETSAWHSIEVDARTGKAVETPAFAYGQEFYRERAPEAKLRDGQAQDAPAPGVAAAVPVAAGTPQDSPGGAASLPPVDLPSATTQGPPSKPQRPDTKATSVPGAAKAKTDRTAPLWPWLIALAVIIILLAIALR